MVVFWHFAAASLPSAAKLSTLAPAVLPMPVLRVGPIFGAIMGAILPLNLILVKIFCVKVKNHRFLMGSSLRDALYFFPPIVHVRGGSVRNMMGVRCFSLREKKRGPQPGKMTTANDDETMEKAPTAPSACTACSAGGSANLPPQSLPPMRERVPPRQDDRPPPPPPHARIPPRGGGLSEEER